MKLTIVNCGDPDEYAVVRYQPLAPAYIAAYTPARWSVEVVDENFQRFDPARCQADLVAFSSIPRHIGRAYDHAAVLARRGVTTVAGGLHVSAVPQEARSRFDCIVRGEAEPVWERLLGDFEAGDLQREYITNFDHSLDELRLPDRSQIHPGYRIASLSTSRGCQNQCTFCYMSSIGKKAYRVIPTDRIIEDFQRVEQKMMVLSDANFLGFTEEHIASRVELCEALIRRRIDKLWAAQITADVVKYPQLPALLYRAGCRMAFIGFETIGAGGLQFIDKQQNIDLDYTEVVRVMQDAGIPVAASLILGLDTHDRDYVQVVNRWLDRARPLFLNLGVLTPMPNTRLYHAARAEGRLLLDGVDLWRHMDKATNTLRYKNFSSQEAEQMFDDIVEHFFRKRNIARTFFYHLLFKRRVKLSLLYLGAALRKRKNQCKSVDVTEDVRK